MADELPQDSVTITLTDAAPLPTPAEGTPPDAAPSEDPAAALADLRKKLEAEAEGRKIMEGQLASERAARQEEVRRRIAAENATRTETTRANVESATAREREFESVSNALTAAETGARQLAQQKAGLMAEGKWEEAAQLDVQIAEVGGDLGRLKAGKAALEEARKAAPKPDAAPAPAPRQEDAREQFIGALPAKEAAWVRSHGDRFFGDQEFNGAVQAAANYALRVLKLTRESEDYFKHIEESVGLRQKAAPVEAVPPVHASAPSRTVETPPAAPAAPRAAPAAPPSRTVVSSSPAPANATTVSLTPDERQMARIQFTKESSPLVAKGMDPEEAYARRKLEIMRENGGRAPVWTPAGRA